MGPPLLRMLLLPLLLLPLLLLLLLLLVMLLPRYRFSFEHFFTTYIPSMVLIVTTMTVRAPCISNVNSSNAFQCSPFARIIAGRFNPFGVLSRPALDIQAPVARGALRHITLPSSTPLHPLD